MPLNPPNVIENHIQLSRKRSRDEVTENLSEIITEIEKVAGLQMILGESRE